MVQINAKRAIRIAVLIAGLVGTFLAANVQTSPSQTAARFSCALRATSTAKLTCHH